jgi:integrase
MTGRPPLPVGTWGSITVEPVSSGYRARTRFRDFDGITRLVERRGRTKGAARAALTGYLSDRTAPSGDDINGESRLSEVAEVWFAERTDLATNSVRRYRDALEDHILPGVGNLRMREATVSRLDRFLKATTVNTGAPTAKLCRSVLSGVMGLAVRHGAIRTNPVRDVAGVTVIKKEPRALTLDEVKVMRAAILAWQDGRVFAPTTAPIKPRRGRPPARDLSDLMDLFLATGVRIGELLAIRWADVDLDAGTVLVTGTIVMSDEKPSRPMRQTKTKTDSSRRELKLPRFAVDTLLRRRVHLVAENANDVIFPSTSGTLRDPGNVRKQLNPILASVGLEWVTPHTFRKTVGTVIDNDSDLRSAADQLGHSSTDTTARHYVARTHKGPDGRAALSQFAPDRN